MFVCMDSPWFISIYFYNNSHCLITLEFINMSIQFSQQQSGILQFRPYHLNLGDQCKIHPLVNWHWDVSIFFQKKCIHHNVNNQLCQLFNLWLSMQRNLLRSWNHGIVISYEEPFLGKNIYMPPLTKNVIRCNKIILLMSNKWPKERSIRLENTINDTNL